MKILKSSSWALENKFGQNKVVMLREMTYSTVRKEKPNSQKNII